MRVAIFGLLLARSLSPTRSSSDGSGGGDGNRDAFAQSAARFILCKPSGRVARWRVLPTASGPPVPLQVVSHPTLCAVAGRGSLGLGSCEGAPTFQLVRSKRYPSRGYNLVEMNRTSGAATGACVDAKGLAEAQLYKCVDSANQGWNVNASTAEIRETFDRHNSILGLSSDPGCTAAKPQPPPPAPAPPAVPPFCPRLHPIGGPKVYDPSGPVFDESSGTWHLFDDEGAGASLRAGTWCTGAAA